MKIGILGTGCSKCKKLAENAEAAVKALGIACEVEKITDINEIVSYGVMLTPALAINGAVVSTGKVLGSDEIQKLLADAAS